MSKTEITIKDILDYGPCPAYTQERLEELFNGRETIDIAFLLAVDIPADHKLDCMLRGGLIAEADQKKLQKFASSRMLKVRGKVDKDSRDDNRNKMKETASDESKTSAAEAVCLAHIALLPHDADRTERRAVIEAEAEIQLRQLKKILKGEE